jgi:hypothetical protein
VRAVVGVCVDIVDLFTDWMNKLESMIERDQTDSGTIII